MILFILCHVLIFNIVSFLIVHVFIYAEEKPRSSPKKKAQTPKGKTEKSTAASPQKVTVVLSLWL